MHRNRKTVAVLMALVTAIALSGCSNGDVRTGTYEGGEVSFSGDNGAAMAGYPIEMRDGTKIIAFSKEDRPKVGSAVTIRKTEGGTWEIVPTE